MVILITNPKISHTFDIFTSFIYFDLQFKNYLNYVDNNEKSVKKLIGYGADVNVTDKYAGKTLLHLAAEKGIA